MSNIWSSQRPSRALFTLYNTMSRVRVRPTVCAMCAVCPITDDGTRYYTIYKYGRMFIGTSHFSVMCILSAKVWPCTADLNCNFANFVSHIVSALRIITDACVFRSVCSRHVHNYSQRAWPAHAQVQCFDANRHVAFFWHQMPSVLQPPWKFGVNRVARRRWLDAIVN